MSETRKDREERLQREYDAYVAECKAQGYAPLNYMNWVAGKKLEEKWE